MSTISFVGTLVVVECTCGMHFAIPKSFQKEALEKGTTVRCPMGCSWHYTQSRNQILEKQLKDERAARLRERASSDQYEARLRDERDGFKNQARAQKAAKTRIKNRIKAGVCPCCNRTFQNLARHMHGQHPQYATESKT